VEVSSLFDKHLQLLISC